MRQARRRKFPGTGDTQGGWNILVPVSGGAMDAEVMRDAAIFRHRNTIIPAATLLAGILIGRFSVHHETATPSTGPARSASSVPERTRSANRPPSEPLAPVTELQRLRNEIRRAQPRNIPNLVHQALQIPDHNDRRLALIEAIHAATPEQCMEIMNQFDMVARETGRSDYGLWTSALFETGKIGGAILLDSWKEQGKTGANKELQATLYGMATQNPSAALAWLDNPANADIPDRQTLLNHVIAGAALKDVPSATRMMAGMPVVERRTADVPIDPPRSRVGRPPPGHHALTGQSPVPFRYPLTSSGGECRGAPPTPTIIYQTAGLPWRA